MHSLSLTDALAGSATATKYRVAYQLPRASECISLCLCDPQHPAVARRRATAPFSESASLIRERRARSEGRCKCQHDSARTAIAASVFVSLPAVPKSREKGTARVKIEALAEKLHTFDAKCTRQNASPSTLARIHHDPT